MKEEQGHEEVSNLNLIHPNPETKGNLACPSCTPKGGKRGLLQRILGRGEGENSLLPSIGVRILYIPAQWGLEKKRCLREEAPGTSRKEKGKTHKEHYGTRTRP